MPDLPIVIPDTAAAPKDYTLSGTQELQLKTVRALIDGSGAASAFLPTLQLLDPNGHVMWEGASSSTVAAGGSADVSWFPGVVPSSGIDFDQCNTGDWLSVKATSFGGNCGDDPSQDNWGVIFISDGNGGIALSDGLQSNPAIGGGIVLTEYGAGGISLSDGQTAQASGGLTFAEDGNGGIRVINSGSGRIVVQDQGVPAGGIQLLSLNGFVEMNSAAITLTGTAISLVGLPIVNPGVPNQLWNNGGVVSIS